MAYKRLALDDVLLYFPTTTRSLVAQLFTSHTFDFSITSPRQTRLGTFRAAYQGNLPKISVNGDLKPHYFLFVFLHELAHFKIHESQKKQLKPHGKEWKNIYYALSKPFLHTDYVPENLIIEIEKFFRSREATFNNYPDLLNALSQIDGSPTIYTLRDLPENNRFSLSNGMRFIKLQQQRTRCKCLCLNNNKHYLVSLSAQINLE